MSKKIRKCEDKNTNIDNLRLYPWKSEQFYMANSVDNTSVLIHKIIYYMLRLTFVPLDC